jgi:drug/metabolite transporter (DMT)-like permease
LEIPETGAERSTVVADRLLAPVAKRQAYFADAGLVGVTVVWGSTFVVIKGALAGTGPFEFVALRFAVAFLALAILFHKRIARLTAEDCRAGAIIGLFLFAGYAFQTAGLQYTTASTSAFITGLCVVFVPIIDFLVLGRRVGKGVVFAVVLAPIGLWLITQGQQAVFGSGDLLTLACALAFAAHIVSISVYATRFDPIALAIVQIGVVAALAMIVALAVERPLQAPESEVLVAVLYTGLLGSALVLGVQTKIQRYTTATHAALIFSLEPVFAAAFAYAFAGETLGVTGLLGAAVMLGAMVVAELKR